MSEKEIERLVGKLIKEKRKIKKIRGEFNDMTFFGFRYCLGRQTFASGICSEYVRTNIALIWDKYIRLMIKEIGEFDKKGYLGMKCYIETWTNLQSFLIKELGKRNDSKK